MPGSVENHFERAAFERLRPFEDFTGNTHVSDTRISLVLLKGAQATPGISLVSLKGAQKCRGNFPATKGHLLALRTIDEMY